MKHMFINTISYQFSHSYDENATNDDVYSDSFIDLLNHVYQGYGNGTCIMFGQTGTGKTYTMSALEEQLATDLFEQEFVISKKIKITMCSFEIQGKKCFDLFNESGNKKEIFLREGEDKQIHIRGANYVDINNQKEFLKFIDIVRKERTSSATYVNENSSRTHAIIRIIFTPITYEGKVCSLTLVDLAGSEMSNDSMYHTAEQRRECADINTSLMCLKDCIKIASQRSHSSNPDKYHIPYRNSKLTILLKDCFENDCDHTLVIATINSNPKDTEHTLNTLSHVAVMCEGDKTFTEDKREIVSEKVDNTILIPPVRYTHSQLIDWISTVRRGKFKKFTGNVGGSVDGKMFCRFGIVMFNRICNGDEKLGKELKTALDKAIKAEADQKAQRQASNREQTIRDKLNKAHALSSVL